MATSDSPLGDSDNETEAVRALGTVKDVTSRELGRASQRESDARFTMIAETAREGMWLGDSNTVTTFASERLADILGRPVGELLGKPVMTLMSGASQAIAAESFAVLAQGRPTRFDCCFERPDGAAVWIMLNAAPILEDGRYAGALAMLTDVTERRQTEIDLQYSRERLAEAQKLALLGSWTLELSTGVVTFSDQLCELVGFDPHDGSPTFDRLLMLVHPDDRRRWEVFLGRVRDGLGPINEELRISTPEGHERWLGLRAEPVPALAGPVVQMHGTMQDVSERKATEEQFSHLALHDKLTGLPNRSLFRDRLNHALARRGAVTVMLLDLDGFKAINDNLGHAAGDAILATVASRLSSTLRPADTIARHGGDEFSVLLEDAAHDSAEEAARRLLDALAAPVDLAGRSVSVQGSIGIAISLTGAESGDELLRQSDAAMFSAKGKGGARFEVFSLQMYGAAAGRVALEGDLRSVGLGSEMTLHYQPLVDLRDGRLCGFEALLRWNHPVRGPIGPDQFIPIAESCGVIVPIGRWVLAEACRQLSAWQADRSSPIPMTMNVNVSSRQLADAHLVRDVARAIEVSSLDPELLTLEITETMIMADEDEVGKRLGELKKLGVRISVDDFGTGYSSIGHLERFPVDELKIDRSFVASLGRNGQDSGVALGVLRLARSLRLKVVAEGIERVEQLAELRRAACTTGQGYYFAKALDPAAIENLLQEVSHYPMPESPRLILVVDDEVALRTSTARILRRAGYDVVEAGTGLEAFRLARESRLDAAILDVGLPDMTGFEVAERLGEMSQGELPIFILSGTAVDVDDRVRGLNLGADAYLTKPIEPRELVAVLGASLRGHGADPAASPCR
jgi:diguanylate cyclase (GGDEF)-like protein/PAS domain S-box-containing protein